MRPKLFGLHAEPGPKLNLVLAILPFILILAIYIVASDARLEVNPDDKLLPSISQMADAVERAAFEPNKRTGEYILWSDTAMSLFRLVVGVSLAAVVGLILGLNTGLYPGFRSMMLPITTVLSIVPPLSILPILFIMLGVGEVSKITLIFLGTMFLIARDIHLATVAIPGQQITKSLTLGASGLGVTYRVVLPQIMPRLLNTTRLSLGAAWLFLIAAEGLASESGLGYRIFLLRRFLSMDMILPYVVWITLIGFSFDYSMKVLVKRLYPWYDPSAKSMFIEKLIAAKQSASSVTRRLIQAITALVLFSVAFVFLLWISYITGWDWMFSKLVAYVGNVYVAAWDLLRGLITAIVEVFK